MSDKEKSYTDYLDKTFLEELNYKVWSTKGSRFNASTRLNQTAKLSNLCSNLLSVYLIALSLLSVYDICDEASFDRNTIAYSITCLSILLLVFRQIEKAKEHHNCGLELSRIYNDLRIYKTLNTENTEKGKKDFAVNITDKYQSILEKYTNHISIDIDLFKTRNAKYHKLSKLDVFKIKIRYFRKTDLVYYVLISLPPIIIFFTLFY
ncbi:SLATT domain-containing protein [Aquimarina sp. RZ0]|uniref:SLATT domain-containing protein n=1 Tax=Aquimarina sp. RZ0 TaxID=2607730 RepID=UPI0011F3646B|nr:SLATT domain-containing protein [Aquimarina sp. RZ0]KAA1246350.1 SLATT domain-containing protein [Aquimarina sp. RZ0]